MVQAENGTICPKRETLTGIKEPNKMNDCCHSTAQKLFENEAHMPTDMHKFRSIKHQRYTKKRTEYVENFMINKGVTVRC